MDLRAERSRRMSFAGRDPVLRKDIPDRLRRRLPVRLPFDHARDPYISAQLKAARKTETQRREESGQGSAMVKCHRPFPELRPKNENRPIRAAFNEAWLKEQRTAVMARFKKERANIGGRPANDRDALSRTPGRER